MNKLRIFISTLLIALMAVPGVKAFTDVPQEAWFAPFVSDLEGRGIIDSGDFFRPADNLNRAEMVKMVIEASVGIENYQSPASPTFDDVPEDAWFAPYMETAATLGIVMGYEDADGNLLGLAGPADLVTRAAAVKILVEAFDLHLLDMMRPGDPFLDVTEDAWFYDYVLGASDYNLISLEADNFRPADPVTRAEMSKMLSIALTPFEEEIEEEMEQEEEEVVEEEEVIEEEEEEEVSGIPFVQTSDPVVAGTVAASDEPLFVASYQFEGKNEPFAITTLTIVNDTTGDVHGDDPTGSFAVKEVMIRYPDQDENEQTAQTVLGSDGTARFGNLDFYVEKDGSATLEVFVTLNSFADVGEQLSGEAIRLVLQNSGNTVDSFKAIGGFSDSVVTTGSGFIQSSTSNMKPLIIRKSTLSFENGSTPTSLFNGQSDLISINVTASEEGSAVLGRMVFTLNISDDAGADLSADDFEIHRDNNLIDDAYIYDPTGAQELSTGSLMAGAHTVIVSFEDPETISAGKTVNFELKAILVGVDNEDSISTRLLSDDENAPLTGLTNVNQESTGKIFVAGDSTAGIFTTDTDFARSVGTARNILWSDRSADLHQYPSVSGGVATTDSGSSDWTNAYLLGTSVLSTNTLSK